ncbi:MAG: WYL domain-containing protein [Gracilimonas sp.]|uniref:helix-turn-helix transcriptional regulator n=1 Tax=Gracilimonas sp. TaxID=1974203 RepID=UPI001AFFA806|nr:WYL domain-containing protein [Gracilimonas sp.]MBO6586788.1 WYL domain-containing protein [Gracilimonas sp.]MBO6615445.1 WYL domain-containing protein [Gracilimonas sp.]
MSVNKNALLRYQVLDRCFRNPGRKFFWQDLLAEINEALEEYNGPESKIKRRQLFDDIKFMESDQGWSIPLERHKDGRKVYYRYSDKDFSISNQPLNEDEKNQIDAAISVLSRFAGAPQFEWVQEMIPVLQDRLGLKQSSREVISIESNIDLKGIEYLGTLYDAIVNELVLKVEYQNFKSDDSFELTFHPHFLKQYNNRWFAFGLNEELDIQTWNLALDRIQNIEQTQSVYIQSDIDWNEYFFDIIGVTRPENGKVETLVLEFTKEQAPYVITKPLHPTQKHESVDGNLRVEIEIIPNYELKTLILSFGEKVKVLKPQSIKERIDSRIQLMRKD